eukprot:TRINITY_DN17551_c0_g1_i1.p1 TRINITY_DN17551_c0_g1~~TRINITY_DN17551_c0_g1_i1.p1  ORF type:complete len:144 (+),score=23.97 TRINITY_DN17551_c0_g1_i1:60-434(+)
MCIRDRNKARLNKIVEKEVTECQSCFYKTSKKVIFQGVDHSICIGCLEDFLKMQIMNEDVKQINCPCCGVEIEESDLKRILPEFLVEKYKQIKKNLVVKMNTDLLHVPGLGCGKLPDPRSETIE